MLVPLRDENPTRHTPWITFGLVALNAIVFLWTLPLSTIDRQQVYYHHGFLPARIARFADGEPIKIQIEWPAVHPAAPERPITVQQTISVPSTRTGIALSLITCMFLHGGWIHLLGNMWFLWVFGNNVEDRLGPVTFLAFYLLGGVGASFCHWIFMPDSTAPVIGASGAVAGVLGAYAITWPWASVRTLLVLIIFFTIVDLPALFVLGVWFVLQIGSAVSETNPGVAWWAHVGGFIVGMIVMPLVRGPTPPPVERPKDT